MKVKPNGAKAELNWRAAVIQPTYPPYPVRPKSSSGNVPPTILIRPEPKPNRIANAIAPTIEGVVTSSTARPSGERARRAEGQPGLPNACAEQHVDEAACHLSRTKQAGDENARGTQAQRRQHRHHVHQDGGEHETLDGETGEHQQEHGRPAGLAGGNRVPRRWSDADVRAFRLLQSRVPREPGMNGQADDGVERGEDHQHLAPVQIFVQRSRQRPEKRRGKSGDQCQVRDAALRVAPAQLRRS